MEITMHGDVSGSDDDGSINCNKLNTDHLFHFLLKSSKISFVANIIVLLMFCYLFLFLNPIYNENDRTDIIWLRGC